MTKCNHLRWTRTLLMVALVTGAWSLCFVTPMFLDYLPYYMMLPEQCAQILVKVLVTVKRLYKDLIIYAWSDDCTTPSTLCQTLSPVHLRFCWFLKQYVLLFTRYWARIWKRDWEFWFLWWECSGIAISSSKKYKPTKQAFSRTRDMQGIVQSRGNCDYSQLPKIQPKNLKVKQIAKGSERGKIFHSLTEKWKKTWMIMFAPNFKTLLKLQQMRKRLFARDTHSNTRLHFTVQSSRQNCLIAAQLRIWTWNFCTVKSFVSVNVIETFLIQFLFRDSLLSMKKFRLGGWSKRYFFLGKVVLDDNNLEKKSSSCLRQTCPISSILFLCQIFVILLINFGCFRRIHLTKNFDESNFWVGNSCIAAG